MMRFAVFIILFVITLFAGPLATAARANEANSGMQPCPQDLEDSLAPLTKIATSCGYLTTWNKNTGRWDNKCHIGAPINPANGEVYLIHLPDFTLHSEGSEITFFRTYRSFLRESGALGEGWIFGFEEHLILPTSSPTSSVAAREAIEYVDETGKSNQFVLKADAYSASSIPGAKLSPIAAGIGYRLDLPEGAAHIFDAQGHLTSIRFPSGQSISLNYQGNTLTEVNDSWGRSLHLAYENGLLRFVTVAHGTLSQTLMKYEYDSSRRLKRATSADGTAETYDYANLNVLGLNHYLSQVHDGEGRIIERHRYNEQGEGVFSASKEGTFSLAFSDLKNRLRKVAVTNEITHQKSLMIYDPSGNQLSRDQKIGVPSANSNRFDEHGRLTAQVQGDEQGGVKTQIGYDGQNPTDFDQSAGADSRKTHFEYEHPHHLVTKIEYPSLIDSKLTKTVTFKYSGKYSGDLVTEQTTHGYTRDLDGQITPFSDVTRFTYDSAGQLLKITDPEKQETVFEYYGKNAGLDSGRLKSLKRPGEPLTEYSKYDWFGNPLRTVYSGKVATFQQTNSAGKLVGDAAGNTYRYDRSGRVLEMIAQTGESKHFSYDDQGKLRSTSIAAAHSHSEIPIPATEAKADGMALGKDLFPPDVQTRFDARGNLLQIGKNLNGKNLVGSFSYDTEDHLTGVTWPNGSSSKVQYDDRGQIIAEQMEDLNWKRRRLTSSGKIETEKNPDGKITQFIYDREGRLIAQGANTYRYLGESQLVSTMSTGESEIAYEYDFSGRVLNEKHRVFPKGQIAREWTVHYDRDLNGNIQKLTYPDLYVVNFSAGKISASDETFFEAKKLSHGRPVLYQQGVFNLSERFDGIKLQERKITGISDLVVHYDQNDRPVLTEDRIRSEKQKYAYSSQGFLTEAVSETQGKETSRWTISYDSLGNPTTFSGPDGKTEIRTDAQSNQPPAHDGSGRVSERAGWKFEYDSMGRLAVALSGSHRVEFGYDPLGRRTYKTADGKTTYFIYDGQNRLIFEETPSDQKKIRYIYRGHEIIALQVTHARQEKQYAIMSDQRLAPQWIQEIKTPQSAAHKIQGSPYDPAEHSVAGSDLHLGTPGQYFDVETGLYYNISRYYDPKTGRYLSPDPTGIFGGANPYLYAQGNPIVFIDPMGTTPSDSEIITEEDANECNQQSGGTPIQPTQTTPINPQLVDLPDEGEVWRVGTNRWNSDFEKMYSDWINTQVGSDFMIKYQIKVDCADAVGVVRSVFSRIYHLPSLVTNGKESVGNSTKTWANLPTIPVWNPGNWQQNLQNDRRFRQYLIAMTDVIDSNVIPLNTYPIKIRDETHPNSLSQYVRPGTVIISHDHAEFVKNIDKNEFDPLVKLSGTTGPGLRSLMLEPMDIEYPTEPGRGFVNWNWTVNCGPHGWKHVASSRMPGYDDQHEQMGLNSFEHFSPAELSKQADDNNQQIQSLQKQLAAAKGAPQDQIASIANSLKKSELDRSNIVTAIAFRQAHPNEEIPESFHNYIQLLAHDGNLPPVTKQIVMDTDQSLLSRIKDRAAIINEGAGHSTTESDFEENYSTPDRDMNDKNRYVRTLAMLQSQKGKAEITERDFNTTLSNQWVDVGNGHKVNAFYYYMALLEDYQGTLISTEPTASVEDRWGYKWVRQHAKDLQTQLPYLQEQASKSQAQYQAYLTAHPPSELLKVELEAESSVSSLEVKVETELGMKVTPPYIAPRSIQEAEALDAQHRLQTIQNELKLIHDNYGPDAFTEPSN